jgi:hypothetical protein
LAEYFQNGYATENTLQIQHNPYQNSNVIFDRNTKINPVQNQHIQKPVSFQYTNNEKLEKEYRKTIPFKLASK